MRIATCFATREERRRPMSADGLVPDPVGSYTHAITIRAPAERVWPWLAQLGAGRAGWYSHDRIDNGGVKSAKRIIPELQEVKPGDVMPAVPGATDVFIVVRVQPPRELVLDFPGRDGEVRTSWEYRVDDAGPGRSRLVERARFARTLLQSSGEPQPKPRFFVERIYPVVARAPVWTWRPLAALGHRFMMARHLRQLRNRAELAAA